MQLDVHKQRAIVRHIAQTTMSNRGIGRIIGVSANTVSELRLRFKHSGLAWGVLAPMPDDAFTLALGTQRNPSLSGKFVHDPSQRSGQGRSGKEKSCG